MRLAAVVVALAVTLTVGCASQIMQGYIGKSVTEAMLDYGAPQNAFDLPDGRRAFQWVYDTTYVTPTTITTNANVVGGYNTAWVNSNTTIAGGQPLTARCVYTLIGTWDATKRTYILTEYRKPSFMCE